MAVPAEGVRIVASMRNVVVFPAPLAPNNPKISPGLHRKLTPSTARTSPRVLSRNFFTRPCASIMEAHFVSIRRGDAKIGLCFAYPEFRREPAKIGLYFVYPESRREPAKIGLYFEPAKIV